MGGRWPALRDTGARRAAGDQPRKPVTPAKPWPNRASLAAETRRPALRSPTFAEHRAVSGALAGFAGAAALRGPGLRGPGRAV